MKKFNIKNALYFGVTMALFKIAEKIWFGDGATTSSILESLISGLLFGILSGFLFGVSLGRFARYFESSKFVENTTKIDIEVDENILFQTGANHFKGIEGVGGKLYLTNKRLVFKSHKLNIQTHELSIDLADIKNVERSQTIGLIDNGLTVISGNNKTDKFVVEKANEWVTRLSGIESQAGK